jgi:hypothetical protein
MYELHGGDLKKLFDRTAYLKDRRKCRGEVFPFDRAVYDTVLGQVVDDEVEEFDLIRRLRLT